MSIILYCMEVQYCTLSLRVSTAPIHFLCMLILFIVQVLELGLVAIQ